MIGGIIPYHGPQVLSHNGDVRPSWIHFVIQLIHFFLLHVITMDWFRFEDSVRFTFSFIFLVWWIRFFKNHFKVPLNCSILCIKLLKQFKLSELTTNFSYLTFPQYKDVKKEWRLHSHTKYSSPAIMMKWPVTVATHDYDMSAFAV